MKNWKKTKYLAAGGLLVLLAVFVISLAIKRPGDLDIKRPGDNTVMQPGDIVVKQPGEIAVKQPDDIAVKEPGTSEDNTGQIPADTDKTNSEAAAAENVERNAEGPVKIPILLYHNIDYNENDWTVSPEIFRSQMTMLKKEGYTTLHFRDLTNYVKKDVPLPEKPILITFDDGYYDNYSNAYRILKELDMKATIFIIGWSFDRSTMLYSDTKIRPHFGGEQGREMLRSGLIDLQSHTFDMHSYSDTGKTRDDAIKRDNESLDEYKKAVKEDTDKMNILFKKEFGYIPSILSYPYGKTNSTGDQAFSENGFEATIGTNDGFCSVLKNDQYSLYGLKRINVTAVNSDELLEEIRENMK